MMAGIAAAWTRLKGVPQWLWMTALAALGLLLIRKDARDDERRRSDQRHADAAAKQSKQIRERADHVEQTSDRVRSVERYDDERMRDTEADALPGYHYRDGRPDND